eukprot:GGOE01036318.1.p1 GENE.GGOE01036318.1~~GGOE01036318.1.p1  ORF type:complete len:234 (+),score=62.40 GGOE01036318.1:30-704(+)
MGDPAEEQAAELEALDAIYGDDLERTEGSSPARFSIKLGVERADGPKVALVITYTPNYPNDVPAINVQPLSGLAKDKAETMTKLLIKEAEENVGSIMVFSLVSKTMEFLENVPSASAVEEDQGPGLRKPRVDDSAAIKHGTLVTKENFLEWKQHFDVERATWGDALRAARAKEMELKKDRLSGRQFFARVSAANANIDWELFNAEQEDLDDLDFDEDESLDAEE